MSHVHDVLPSSPPRCHWSLQNDMKTLHRKSIDTGSTLASPTHMPRKHTNAWSTNIKGSLMYDIFAARIAMRLKTNGVRLKHHKSELCDTLKSVAGTTCQIHTRDTKLTMTCVMQDTRMNTPNTAFALQTFAFQSAPACVPVSR